MNTFTRHARVRSARGPRGSRLAGFARQAAPIGFIAALGAGDCGGDLPFDEGLCAADPRITEPIDNQMLTPEQRQLRGTLTLGEGCTVERVTHRVGQGPERNASSTANGTGFLGQVDLEGLAEGIHWVVVTAYGENSSGRTELSDSIEFYYRPGLEGDFYLVTVRPGSAEIDLTAPPEFASNFEVTARAEVWRTAAFVENVVFEDPEGVPGGATAQLIPVSRVSLDGTDTLAVGATLVVEFAPDAVSAGEYEIGIIAESLGSLIRRGALFTLRLTDTGAGACADFDLRPDFDPVQVTPGGSDAIGVFVDRSPGFEGPVQLMMTAGPDGTQPNEVLSEAAFSPNPVPGDRTPTTLSFNVRGEVTPGATYELTISGGSPSLETDPEWCTTPVTFEVIES